MAKRRHHLTNVEADAVADFACEILGALRMPQWTILIMEDPADDDCLAEIKPVDGRYVAQLYLSKEWMQRSTQERRGTIVHEVLHLVHARLSDAVITDSLHLMHDHEHDDWSRRVRREFELMVDHLAFFISNTHNVMEVWEQSQAQARPKSRSK